MRVKMKAVWFLTILAAVAVSVIGGGGCDSGDNGVKTVSIRGFAELDVPVVGATVRLLRTEGTLVYESTGETCTSGTFLLLVPEDKFVTDYRIEVTGGTLGSGGQPFDGMLTAEIRAHDIASHSYWHVGPVSSIISAYLDAHPEIAHAEAAALVTSFLGLPGTVDWQTDLYGHHEPFDPALFRSEMDLAGGWEAFLSQLVAEIDDGGSHAFAAGAKPRNGRPSQSLRQRLVTRGLAGTVLQFTLKNLAAGAVSYVGGKAMGWILGSIFGEKDGPSTQDVLNALAQQAQTLTEIKSEIENLEQSVDEAKNEILTAIDRSTYDTVVSVLQAPVSRIQSLHQRLLWLASGDPGDSRYVSEAAQLQTDIENADILAALTQIQNTLQGAAGADGALEVWGRLVTGRSFIAPYDFSATLQEPLGYWAGIQIDALTLMFEAAHASGAVTQSTMNRYLDLYRSGVTAQSDIYRKWLAMHMAYMIDSGPHASGSPFRAGDDWAFDQVMLHATYTGAPTLKDADLFAAQVLDQDPRTRLYVYVSKRISNEYDLWDAGWEDLNYMTPELREVAAGTSIFGTTISHIIDYPPADGSDPANRPTQGPFVIFDFGVLPAGTYQLSKPSGSDGINNAYMNFRMNISSANPNEPMLIWWHLQT